MKKLKLTKLIASSLVMISVTALNPIAANAAWIQDDRGWWYSEGNSWATGWRNIDGKWYYFLDNGYMARNVEINGYKLGADGSWISTPPTNLTSNNTISSNSVSSTSGSYTPSTSSNSTSNTSSSYTNSTGNNGTSYDSDFAFDANTGTITKYYGSSSSVVIPNIINGVSVTSIGNDAFKNCGSLKSITIPNSVTSIGDSAFACCTNLASITIPNSVTKIGQCAFDYCSGLTSVVIPDGVTSIEIGTFGFCASLTSLTIPDSVTSIGSDAFWESPNIKFYVHSERMKYTLISQYNIDSSKVILM